MSTKLDRQMAATRLNNKWIGWMKMDDTQLSTEVRKSFPSITAASRDEMLKFLTMDFVITFIVP